MRKGPFSWVPLTLPKRQNSVHLRPHASNRSEPEVRPHPEEPRGAARQGGRLYFLASLISQAFALLRYLILARLLGPEQLGLAAALTVTAGFFDMITDTGSDRFLIQDRYGEGIEVQKLVQLVFVGRGILVAAGLVVLAKPMAYFYDSPSLVEGLAFLAIEPLILGFLHLDIRRLQRSHDFRPEAIGMIAAEGSGLLAAVVSAWATRDFKAVVFGLVTRAMVRVICSHLLAQRRYRLGWDPEHAARLAHFSTPLILNGFMLFIVSQGDRMIVGRHLGMTVLGYYSTIALLISVPSNVLAGYIHTISIPLIAARRDSRHDQIRLTDRLGGQTLLLALIMAVGFAIVAPPMVPILFGSRFTQPALLIGMIGILQATRFLLSWPTITALALGRSAIVLMSNLVHFSIFPGALIGEWLIGGLIGIVVGFIGAEALAVAVALVLMNHSMNRSLFIGFARLGALALTGAAIVGWQMSIKLKMWPAGLCMFVGSVWLMIWIYCHERDVVKEFLNRGTFRLGVKPRDTSDAQ
jgi:O-antigen/teichoic acid export membrane protein